MTAAPVNGHVSRGFEPVADAFADNFRHRGDTAASCVVYAQGAPVVDIWAGQTARGAWTPSTPNPASRRCRWSASHSRRRSSGWAI